MIRGLLPADGAGLTADEIRAKWEDDADGVPKPGKRTIERDLRDAPGILRTGAGSKGDPFRFSSAPTGMLSGIESGPGAVGPESNRRDGIVAADRPPDEILETTAAGAGVADWEVEP